MLPSIILLSIIICYFTLLLVLAWYSSRGSNNESFFIGKKSSSWLLVAYGMIGTSLSGVTYLSVPGGVANSQFGYLMIVAGYVIGYFVVAFVLLPLYYRLNLTSIYTYLELRFNRITYVSGASLFLISRTLGATIRIYLVLNVLQIFILQDYHIPFIATTAIILCMILLYTYEGGVKTIVLTDTLQTTFMIFALIASIGAIMYAMNLDVNSLWKDISAMKLNTVVDTDVKSKSFFLKHLLSGMLITISMTGLDQEMMQKNISCKSIGDAQKNMISFSLVLFIVNVMFLVLGACLVLFASMHPEIDLSKPDDLFPTIALKYLSPAIGIIFIIGLISALFPSADGALTALTSSFCIDILQIDKMKNVDETSKIKIRKTVHLCMTLVFFSSILFFKWLDSKSIITTLLAIAGYTYGPLLGIYSFGILTKRNVVGIGIPIVCLLAPTISFLLSTYSKELFGGYQIGFELLMINAVLTFIGCFILSIPSNLKTSKL